MVGLRGAGPVRFHVTKKGSSSRDTADKTVLSYSSFSGQQTLVEEWHPEATMLPLTRRQPVSAVIRLPRKRPKRQEMEKGEWILHHSWASITRGENDASRGRCVSQMFFLSENLKLFDSS